VLRNYELFGTTSYMFSDDTFHASLDKVRSYADLVQSLPFDFSWAGYCRIDMVNKKQGMLEALVATQPEFINFGIETFNHQAGKKVGKGLHPDKVKETLHQLKDTLGDKTILSCNFIVGLQHEDEDSIWETYEWLTSSDSPVDAFNFTPLYLIHYKRDIYDSTSDFSNALGRDPQNFGYVYNKETGFWAHKLMNSNDAHRIVNEIYEKPEAKQKTLANRIGFYGRLKNLGFSFSDLTQECKQPNNDFLLKILNKKLSMRDEYLDKLLNSAE